jgi:hypothetical protein
MRQTQRVNRNTGTTFKSNLPQYLFAFFGRSLLYYLALYSLPPTAKRVVAGTCMTKFTGLEKPGAAKGKKYLDLATDKPDLNFPYVEPNEAWEVLNRFLNLDDITQENKTLAQHVLQGRLRYIVCIIVEIFQLVQGRVGKTPLSIAEKNTLFMDALSILKLDIKRYIEVRVEDLVARNLHQKTLCRNLENDPFLLKFFFSVPSSCSSD